MSAEHFPVLRPTSRREDEARAALQCPTSVPWAMLAPHEAQALHNHYQTLRRLAERGGLDPNEMVCVLEDRRWTPCDLPAAIARLQQLLTVWERST